MNYELGFKKQWAKIRYYMNMDDTYPKENITGKGTIYFCSSLFFPFSSSGT